MPKGRLFTRHDLRIARDTVTLQKKNPSITKGDKTNVIVPSSLGRDAKAWSHSQWWYRDVSYCRKDGNGEKGVFSSFLTLTGKGRRTLLTITFLRGAFFLVVSTKNKSPLISRNCNCRPWHGVGVDYNNHSALLAAYKWYNAKLLVSDE